MEQPADSSGVKELADQSLLTLKAFSRYIDKKNPTVMAVYVAGLSLEKMTKHFISNKMGFDEVKREACLEMLEKISDSLLKSYYEKAK